ncbi:MULTISPECIES: twin-arginine translocase TatA/TatE family subunit [unclassified Pseudonocardia]|uniref:twin-arginine translocase TatA/TatE family subunit n=2 Tax=Pseudonocardia TaxID=1847 RepID=UPI0025CFC5D6|nr:MULTISPECIES: twin-arginine translocase TatA/TatE family subunit [unclassified Pseudonocardia]
MPGGVDQYPEQRDHQEGTDEAQLLAEDGEDEVVVRIGEHGPARQGMTMFGISYEKLFVLAVIALFVLGPERLPAAATWVGQNIRRVREFAGHANRQLRSELGPEFDQLREPLEQLRGPLQDLRSLRDPRSALMRHLLDEPSPPSNGPVPSARPAVDTDAT